jgi:hypothetical protein
MEKKCFLCNSHVKVIHKYYLTSNLFKMQYHTYYFNLNTHKYKTPIFINKNFGLKYCLVCNTCKNSYDYINDVKDSYGFQHDFLYNDCLHDGVLDVHNDLKDLIESDVYITQCYKGLDKYLYNVLNKIVLNYL